MKIFCNGFNLYGQLGRTEHLLENLIEVFGGYLVDDLSINHSFSVIKVNENYKIIHKNREIELKSCGNIIKMCSNDERVVILNNKGNLFKIDLTDIDTICDITNLFGLANEQIVNISCGSKLTIARSDKGSLYHNTNKLSFNNANIVDIQCGREHCILLDESGNVYTFGRGSRGQLGHGNLEDESEPIQVNALGGIKITHIAAGGWHSCALSEDGDLYSWGWNGNGQLGLGTQEKGEGVSVMASPHVIDFPDPQNNAVKVACGNRHTIVLLDNNHLLGCGWNKYKQLTSLNKENYHAFTYLHDLSKEEVAALKCGPWNSVVICK